MNWINPEKDRKAYHQLVKALYNENNADGIEATANLLTSVMLKHLACLQQLALLLDVGEHFDWATPETMERIQSAYMYLTTTTLSTYDLLRTSTPFCSTSPSISEALEQVKNLSTGAGIDFNHIDS